MQKETFCIEYLVIFLYFELSNIVVLKKGRHENYIEHVQLCLENTIFQLDPRDFYRDLLISDAVEVTSLWT